MTAARLGQHRAHAPKPRKSACDVRNRELKGFGIKVLPSATPFETVAGEVFRRYARDWKPSTLKVGRNYCSRHILPWLEERPIVGISAHDVRRRFASLHNTPVSADRAAPILSVILRQAKACGYRPRETDPCAGIGRYCRRGRQRFPAAAGMRRIGAVPARHEGGRPQATAIIRLLLLTGCRKGEIVTLKWRFCREGNLFPPDGKTGPRTVWLSSAAHAILDGVPQVRVGIPVEQGEPLHDRGGGRPAP